MQKVKLKIKIALKMQTDFENVNEIRFKGQAITNVYRRKIFRSYFADNED